MGKRRQQDDGDSPKAKKPKLAEEATLQNSDVDFPRGGGTSLSQSEVKTLKSQARQEADTELFKESVSKRSKKPKNATPASGKHHGPRIERLSYKKMAAGMKILGQIVSVHALALVVSLPNQLYGHVPITNISSQFTTLLEKMDDMEEDEDDEATLVPQLSELFVPGQYVRTVVSAVGGGNGDNAGLGKSRDETARLSRKVELSLAPERINSGLQISDITPGFTITASVKSIEDHGYLLDLGIPNTSGFLASSDVPQDLAGQLHIGQLVDVTVLKILGNGRTCNVTIDRKKFTTTASVEVTNATAILPGTLVQASITAVQASGVNVQVLGYFDGSIDQIHLSSSIKYSEGKKIKARVLYEASASPPRFALATLDHVVRLEAPDYAAESSEMHQRYPLGTIVQNASISRIDSERGVYVDLDDGLQGFVHISHISDEHIPSLPGGKWRVGSSHPARITGFYPFDGLLQLSMKPSVLEQSYIRLEDVKAGQVVKGTVKSLKENGLFISLSDNLDGVVWPNHYADITLKNPGRRFKEGISVKCRVLVVDPIRKRLVLTCKKSLVDSELPILSDPQDIKVGLVTHGVVFKIFERHALVEFYNNIQAFVPSTEISEQPVSKLQDALSIGKVVKVRIIAHDVERHQLTASIRQASTQNDVSPIESIEVGHVVEGTVLEVHKENAVLSLQPSGVRALLSLDNLANHRGVTAAQVRVALKAQENLPDLVVVSRNPEKGFVLVSSKPKGKSSLPKTSKSAVSLDTVEVGHTVIARVTRHLPHAALLKVGSHLGGIIHRTDISDDYDKDSALPAIHSVVKATVVAVDRAARQVSLSLRPSRLQPNENSKVTDREVQGLADLKPEDSVRGFIKQITDHGLFVSLGRNVTARVQIRELFDEFVKEWQPRFAVGQVVQGKVISVDATVNKVEFTLRSDHARQASSALTLSNLSVGDKITGVVKRIEDYGLFVQLDNSKLSGLCHKSELADNEDADVSTALHGFRQGDKVQALVLKMEKGRISLSLKPSHFSNDTDTMNVDDVAEEESGEEDDDAADLESVEEVEVDNSEAAESASDDDQEEDELPTSLSSPIVNSTGDDSQRKSSSLQLSGGFAWTVHQDDDVEMPDISSDEDSDAAQASRNSKKKKRKVIEQDLTANLDKAVPESNSDFERILLSSPNSSFLWIKYMSFQLQLSEVDKAREIARRALRTINFREEQERLNVWIALLNLENVYGTEEELDKTFKEASRANDPKTVHLHLASIFEESEKWEKAEELYKRTWKKFGTSSKVWFQAAQFYFQRGDFEAGRQLLPRSFQSLEKRKHLKTISRFAQLEYKLGDAERGKTIFEGIVDSHPKRWDLWSVYTDMEASQGNIQSIRSIFERLLTMKLTTHKAKFFFKKWLALEKSLGDEDGETNVKEKAIAWTEKAKQST